MISVIGVAGVVTTGEEVVVLLVEVPVGMVSASIVVVISACVVDEVVSAGLVVVVGLPNVTGEVISAEFPAEVVSVCVPIEVISPCLAVEVDIGARGDMMVEVVSAAVIFVLVSLVVVVDVISTDVPAKFVLPVVKVGMVFAGVVIAIV